MTANAAATADDIDLGVVPRRRWSGKRLVLFVILPLLLVVGGGGAYLLLSERGDAGAAGGRPDATKPLRTAFLDLPDFIVNIEGRGRATSFFKVSVSIEVPGAQHVERLRPLQPRIVDSLQIYLRELRVDDLRGSAGLVRMREEILRRVRASVDPVPVSDVLFREMLVQ